MVKYENKNPRLSAIVPVYNDKDGLQHTIQSLVNQNIAREHYEIIIVDNGSTDDTLYLAEKYRKIHPALINTAVEDKIPGSYAARNKGISLARGRVICFLDSDMTVERDYLGQILDYFDRYRVDYLGCQVCIYSHKDTLSAKFNIANDFHIKSYLENNHFVPTCCLTVRKDAIEKVGCFDSRLESGGDLEFGERIYEAGLKQAYNGNIVVYHPARWQYTSLVKKGRRVARGIAQLSIFYPNRYGSLYRGYFRLRRYMPANPLNLYHRYKDLGLSVNLVSAFVLSFFHLPIRLVSLIELLRYTEKP